MAAAGGSMAEWADYLAKASAHVEKHIEKQVEGTRVRVAAHVRKIIPLLIGDNVPYDFETLPPSQRIWVGITAAAGLLEASRLANDGILFQLGTLSLIGLNFAVFFEPGKVSASKYGLNSWSVISQKEHFRLVTCAFLHRDALHLSNNIVNLLSDGAPLEAVIGTARFLIDTASILFMASVGCCLINRLEYYVTGNRLPYFLTTGIGFSGVGLGIKMYSARHFPARVLVLGVVPLPSDFAVWAHVALAHLAAPSVSLVAHVTGVVAGLAWSQCPWIGDAVMGIVSGPPKPRRLRPARRPWRWISGMAHLAIAAAALSAHMYLNSNRPGAARWRDRLDSLLRR